MATTDIIFNIRTNNLHPIGNGAANQFYGVWRNGYYLVPGLKFGLPFSAVQEAKPAGFVPQETREACNDL